MRRSTLPAFAMLALCSACAHPTAQPAEVRAQSRPPEPRAEPKRSEVRLTRPCDQVQLIPGGATLDDAPLHRARLRKIGPPSTSYGFVRGGELVLYIEPKTLALYAVPLAGGTPRRLSPEGQTVSAWWPDPHAPDRVIYEQGTFFSLPLDSPDARPTPAEDPQEARLAPLREVLRRHGHRSVQFGNSSVDLWGISEGLGVAGIGASAEEERLFAVDARTGELRPLMPERMRNIWTPAPLDERRAIFQARDGHLYVTNLETSELACISAALSPGLERLPFYATTSDHRLLAYESAQVSPKPAEAPFELHVVNLVEGVDRRVLHGKGSSLLPLALPGTHRFVVLKQLGPFGGGGVFYAFDASSPPVRLSDPLPFVQNAIASPDGRHLLFSRGRIRTSTASEPPPPPPEEPEQPTAPPPGPPPPPSPGLSSPGPLLDNEGRGVGTCDPIGCLGCGWQSNGCGTTVWCGYCGPPPAPPPPDPADGLYVMQL